MGSVDNVVEASMEQCLDSPYPPGPTDGGTRLGGYLGSPWRVRQLGAQNRMMQAVS